MSDSPTSIPAIPEPPSPEEEVEAFISHWQSISKTGTLPRLADYLDHASPRSQPDIAIADVNPDGTVKVRLYGTRRVKIFGSEWTGRDPFDNFSPAAAKAGMQVTLTALRHPCGATAIFHFENKGAGELPAYSTILPLETDTPDALTFIHHLKFCEDLGEDDEPLRTLRFDELRFIDIGAGVPEVLPE